MMSTSAIPSMITAYQSNTAEPAAEVVNVNVVCVCEQTGFSTRKRFRSISTLLSNSAVLWRATLIHRSAPTNLRTKQTMAQRNEGITGLLKSSHRRRLRRSPIRPTLRPQVNDGRFSWVLLFPRPSNLEPTLNLPSYSSPSIKFSRRIHTIQRIALAAHELPACPPTHPPSFPAPQPTLNCVLSSLHFVLSHCG